MKNTLISFGLVLVLAACNNANNSTPKEPNSPILNKIDKVDWLLGTWEQNLENGTFSEDWRKKNDSTFLGKSWAVMNGDTVFSEKISLTQVSNNLYYTPSVKDQNEGKAIQFKLTSLSDSLLIFENPEHDFPQKISYRKVTQDSLMAEISGKVDNKEASQQFPFKRVQ
jgi:hypothetical protein